MKLCNVGHIFEQQTNFLYNFNIPTHHRKLGLVKTVALDKCLWLCRHNSGVIEVWNTGKQQLKTTIDIRDLIG